jgi:hypothetical protein
MSDHDRGAYAPPTDAPLTFDARQPVRGSRPIPMTLIISVLVLAGLGAAIFLFYRQGARQAGQPPQAVGAPVTAMKAPPPAEAQPADPAAGLQIYKTEGGQPAQSSAAPARPPSFTPAPEQPAKRAEAQPQVVVSPPAALPPAQAQPALRPALPAQPPAAPPVKLAQAAPAPQPAPKAAAPAVKPVTPPPAAKTEVTPPAKAVAAAPAKEKAPPPAAPAKTAAATPAPATGAPSGSFVQIGAVSSQALADKAWTDAAAVAPGQSAGKGKNVEKVDRDGKTLYRVQITGFASKADATAYCAKLKAAGKDCFAR